MGQYRQWLYYREVNQQLQAQLKQQEQVLQQLEEQAHALEQALAEHHEPIYTNPLVKALLSEHQREQALAVIEQQGETVPHAPRTEEAHAVTTSEQASVRSEARNEDAPAARQPLQRAPDAPSVAIWDGPISTVPPATPEKTAPPSQRPDASKASAIFGTPVEEASQNQPELNSTAPAEESDERLVDQQADRVNQSIQRWAKRWRRDTSSKPGQERRLEGYE
ncbi:hypothetical protein [Ktedonobacter sp. SOSP1-85]|uniref:hypothetical protein n=1 Tax=Ktedonobacter sp. SOSP1-85 TaxID=2778367 RepID=UPI001915EDE6|nr:hypothetical protein [Ktedonobacter sp. SOSP1-85]